MVFQRIRRILRRTERIHVGLFDERLRRMLSIGQRVQSFRPNCLGIHFIQCLSDSEIALKLQMRPMENRISRRIGQRSGKCHKTLFIAALTGNERFRFAVLPHQPPLVMVVAQPNLGDILRGAVLPNIFGTQVTMIIDNRHMLCVLMIQPLGRLIFKQEMFIHKCFHRFFPSPQFTLNQCSNRFR